MVDAKIVIMCSLYVKEISEMIMSIFSYGTVPLFVA
jgi:hypothetical protein